METRLSEGEARILLALASIWFAYVARGRHHLAISRVEFQRVSDFPDFTSAEIIDAAVMSKSALVDFFASEIAKAKEEDVLL